MAATSEFVNQAWVAAAIHTVKAALVGLETLSDAQAASYLNAHRETIPVGPCLPAVLTTAMITEARAAKA